MKTAPLVLMALNGLVWGGLSWMGWDTISYRASQHVAAHPNASQIGYYLAVPLVMLTLSLLPAALLGQTKWSAVANLWSALTLMAVVPYFLAYGGGI